MTAISHQELLRSIGSKVGVYDVACPMCGPERRSAVNQRRKVLRVWVVTPMFATYRCARCDAHGHLRDEQAPMPDPAALEKAQAAARRFAASTARAKRERARWLWSQRRPITGTIAETYLRTARAYGGPLPATLGFLPARGEHAPAMISAFGIPVENADGMMSLTADLVCGVHLTRLAADGSEKACTETDKIMVGCPRGAPIALASFNDLLGLAITEGIEDGLSVAESTGLATWAAGSASFMPALAAVVPEWIESVTVLVDDDQAGRRNAYNLANHLDDRGFETRLVTPRVLGSLA